MTPEALNAAKNKPETSSVESPRSRRKRLSFDSVNAASDVFMIIITHVRISMIP